MLSTILFVCLLCWAQQQDTNISENVKHADTYCCHYNSLHLSLLETDVHSHLLCVPFIDFNPFILHSSVNSSCESRRYRSNRQRQCLLRWLRGDTSVCWWWEQQETSPPPVSSSQQEHSSPPRLSVFLPGPLVSLMDDCVARKRQKNPLSCCFSDADLTLCLLWCDRGEDRSHGDTARLKHSEPSYNILELHIQTREKIVEITYYYSRR